MIGISVCDSASFAEFRRLQAAKGVARNLSKSANPMVLSIEFLLLDLMTENKMAECNKAGK